MLELMEMDGFLVGRPDMSGPYRFGGTSGVWLAVFEGRAGHDAGGHDEHR